MMKKMLFNLSALLVLLVATSCEHRPLVDPETGTAKYVRIYIDEHIKNVTEGFYADDIERPEFVEPGVMRVALCDPNTGRVVSERYLQHYDRDERGYYLDGYIAAPAGEYKLLVYNFGTETTQIKNESNCFGAEGYTNHISMQYYSKLPRMFGTSRPNYDQMNLLYEPDHLWTVADDKVVIREYNGADTLRNSDGDFYTASTIVESYYIQVKVNGAQWMSGSSTLLTGVAGSKKLFANEMVTTPPAILYFEMKERQRKTVLVPKKDEEGNVMNNGETEETQSAYLYATFNTWGKLPDTESLFKITFSFVTVGGGNQTETIDITDYFKTEDAINHRWIIIEKEIDIKEPECGGGGFTPGVDDWDDEEHNFIV